MHIILHHQVRAQTKQS